MKKQSGFTLIELMVVMAIIAILATAGLSAYTGYIKKARDTTRIADLAAINTIVLASMATDGLPPANAQTLVNYIKAANNGQRIDDPLYPSTGTGSSDSPFSCTAQTDQCQYSYGICDDGTGYILVAYFESSSNTSLYADNQSGPADISNDYYDIGSCKDGVPWMEIGGSAGTDPLVDYS